MTLSKESILSETHYGLNIYAYVLRQYNPGTVVLSLSGRDCKPALNPFNSNKPTLQIKIVNECAQHYDTEIESCKGDAFDFAGRHFNLSGDQLHEKLNEVLHLRIGTPSSYNIVQEKRERQAKPFVIPVTMPQFSYFKAPVSNTYPCKPVTIIEVYELVKSNLFANQTSALRTITDKKAAKAYKATNFDYVTFSGTFVSRADKALQKHSGLLTIDLDHISNTEEWISRLLNDEYFETELLFTSPSGDGLKWIIPIDINKATHLNYFKAISQYLLATYNLQIDSSGSDCSRACFYHTIQTFISIQSIYRTWKRKYSIRKIGCNKKK